MSRKWECMGTKSDCGNGMGWKWDKNHGTCVGMGIIISHTSRLRKTMEKEREACDPIIAATLRPCPETSG